MPKLSRNAWHGIKTYNSIPNPSFGSTVIGHVSKDAWVAKAIAQRRALCFHPKDYQLINDVMFFILFGWSTKSKTLLSGNLQCANCDKDAFHELTEVTKKFDIFFIPIFTYSRKFYLQCLVCGGGYQLKEEFVKSILTGQSVRATRSTVLDRTADKIAELRNKKNFCANCGNKILEDAKFCKKCGKEIDHLVNP